MRRMAWRLPSLRLGNYSARVGIGSPVSSPLLRNRPEHRFRSLFLEKEVRAELGIPIEAPVVGHVGRFVPAKNHRYLLEIAEEILKEAAGSSFLTGRRWAASAGNRGYSENERVRGEDAFCWESD